MTLNETYEKEVRIPLHIVNVPKNVVMGDGVDTLRVTVRDKGWFVLALMYGDHIHNVNVDFSSYAKSNGEGVVPASDLVKQISQMLSNSARITVLKPEKIEFFFNYGSSKRVPVKMEGRIIPDQAYYLVRTQIWPDSVTVYATEDKLRKISYVTTEQLNCVNFTDTLYRNADIKKIRGTKIVPSNVKLKFFTDVLTEESVDVPISGVNMPEGKILRTFPSRVKVKFITGVGNFRHIRPNDFSVVVDYNEISNHPSDKCNLYLRTVPHGISRAKMIVNSVDYLIEGE